MMNHVVDFQNRQSYVDFKIGVKICLSDHFVKKNKSSSRMKFLLIE